MAAVKDIEYRVTTNTSQAERGFGKLTDISGQFGHNLGKGFDGLNVSLGDLSQRIVDVKAKLASAPAGGEAFNRYSRELQTIQMEFTKAKLAADGFANAQDSSLTPAMRRSNYAAYSGINIISDLQYGYLGIMNNIQQTAAQMSFLAQAQDVNTGKAMGWGAALRSLGASMVTGPNAILFGIMGLTTLIGFLTTSTSKATKETNQFNEILKKSTSDARLYKDTLAEAVNKLDSLTVDQLQDRIIGLQKTLRDLQNPGMWTIMLAGLHQLIGVMQPFGKSWADINAEIKKTNDLLSAAEKTQGNIIEQGNRDIKFWESLKKTQGLTLNQAVDLNNLIAAKKLEIGKYDKTSIQLLKDEVDLEQLKYDLQKISASSYLNSLNKIKKSVNGNSEEELRLLKSVENQIEKIKNVLDTVKRAEGISITGIKVKEIEGTEKEKLSTNVKKAIDDVKNNLLKQGFKWDSSTQSFVTNIAIVTKAGMQKVKPGKNPIEKENIKALKSAFENSSVVKSADIFAQSFRATFTDAMIQGWSDIFGEANSLLEKFLANIVSGFADLAAKDIAKSIFDFGLSFLPGGSILSGIGSLFGLGSAGGGGAEPAMPAMPTMPTANLNRLDYEQTLFNSQQKRIVLQLNDRTVGEVMIDPYMPASIRKALHIRRGRI